MDAKECTPVASSSPSCFLALDLGLTSDARNTRALASHTLNFSR